MIVTLATQIIFRGIAEIVLGNGGSISVTNTEGFSALGGKVGRIPYILFLVLILGIIAAVILGKCTFGRRVYAIGTNRLAAYYSGIHVQKIRFVIYTLMGTISGLCALFLMSSSFGANTTTGNGFEMDAIAMAVFGGISSTGGKGNIAGGLISAFIIVCLRVGLGQRNIHPQVILLIIGMFMDITPAILIFTPIFLPIAQSFGMSDIQFGVMLIFNMCLGNITPPVGSVLFVGCGIGHVSIEEVTPKLIPYFLVLIVMLLLVTFVPGLSLGVPSLMGLV